jgi:hypothetical protein
MGVALFVFAGRPLFVVAPAGAVIYVLALLLLRAVSRDEVALMLRGFRFGDAP